MKERFQGIKGIRGIELGESHNQPREGRNNPYTRQKPGEVPVKVGLDPCVDDGLLGEKVFRGGRCPDGGDGTIKVFKGVKTIPVLSPLMYKG